jgi:hypothetical protein
MSKKKCDLEASKKLGGLGPQGAVEPLERKSKVADKC